MSLYSDYLHEMGWGIIEDCTGFITYRITAPQCYVKDVYIKKGYRNRRTASAFCNSVSQRAKAAGCSYLTGSVDPTCPGWEDRRAYMLQYGFYVINDEPNYIVFKKDI